MKLKAFVILRALSGFWVLPVTALRETLIQGLRKGTNHGVHGGPRRKSGTLSEQTEPPPKLESYWSGSWWERGRDTRWDRSQRKTPSKQHLDGVRMRVQTIVTGWTKALGALDFHRASTAATQRR